MAFPSYLNSQSRKMQFHVLAFHFIFLIRFVSADYLQNPDFEKPPTNLKANSSSLTVTLNENNTIPGWTFQGTVQYVRANQTIALPDNGHAIQLGEDGKINQSFIASGYYKNYVLTFTLAPGGRNCSSFADIQVSGPDSQGIFSSQQNLSKEGWLSYGQLLGRGGHQETVNLVFESLGAASDDNSTCWPLIDSLLVKAIDSLVQGKDNLLVNGDFEFGPEFQSNSTDGVLLESALSPVQSALTQWIIVGRIRYIDSKNFFVPNGNAAVEIVSGVLGGIHTEVTLTEGSAYNLGFTLGDAKNGCEGDFLVQVQAGSVVQNFTIKSNGTGSAQKSSLKFKGTERTTPISFISYSSSQTKDGIFCGPVVDDVVLLSSHSLRLAIKPNVLIYLLFLIAIF